MPAQTADAVIIGAGVVGAGVAHELARGGRRVVIVDRNPGAGQGSTSASSAIIRLNYSTWAGVATAWEAENTWEAWADHLGHVDPNGLARYIQTGVLVLDSPDFHPERFVGFFDRIGIPYTRLDAAEVTHRFGYLDNGRHHPPKRISDEHFWDDPVGSLGGLHTPEGGFVDDPSLAARNLVHAATREGARTVFRAQVAEITRSGGRVRGVVLDGGDRISAPVVVNCAGPHSAIVNGLAGVLGDFTVATAPLRQEVHHVPRPADVADGAPVVADTDLGTYFSPRAGGVLVGGTEPACDTLEWLGDPDVYRIQPTVEAYETQTLRLARRMPSVTVPGRPKGVVGVYDVSDDWIPIYDRTALDGFYVAIGTSGNQFKNAPVIGQIMAALIDAVENGHDHDADPVVWTGPRTGVEVPLGHYSRRRENNPDSSHSVLG